MHSALSADEFAAALATFDRTAYRLELQREYREPCERETVRRFLAGDPQPPTDVDELRAWFSQVAALTGRGRVVRRVRVHEDPPSPYQRWERWIGTWNRAAGEEIRYMTRRDALDVGLLPAAGDLDWWLLDDSRLIVMRFDAAGRRVETLLVTDSTEIEKARAWWDLAVRHSAPDTDARSAPTAA
jgi:hypothetical protein